MPNYEIELFNNATSGELCSTYLLLLSGAKINFGRAYIGSHEHPSQSGFKHWEEMSANPNTFITRTHFLDNHPDFSANK